MRLSISIDSRPAKKLESVLSFSFRSLSFSRSLSHENRSSVNALK